MTTSSGSRPGEPHLDAARLELAADLERSLAEEVEQVEMERRSERFAHATGDLGCLFVTAGRGGRELLLDRLYMTVELHVTSL